MKHALFTMVCKKKLKGLIQILDLCILHRVFNSSIGGNNLTELTHVLQQI